MIERALFLVAPPGCGKSVQLRSMFADRRFGTDGAIPKQRNPKQTIRVSHDRRLLLRLASPHERNEAPEQWLDMIEKKTRGSRWCFAGALQPEAENKMPDVVACLRLFSNRFRPERMRAAFLSPDRRGKPMKGVDAYVSGLWLLRRAEALKIDAQDREANGLLLADFFDFA